MALSGLEGDRAEGAEDERGHRTADYEYHLPAELIAQTPLARRDESRLMVVERGSGQISHASFGDLVSLIAPGDALVRNTSRVIRARLLGHRPSGAPAEVLLLRPTGESLYEAMVHPGGKLGVGRIVHVAPGFDVEIVEMTDRRTRIVRLHTDAPASEAIERHGHVPLPPYIRRADEAGDADRYQTVYAREAGSIAAPTAGLHFTPELLLAIEAKGVRLVDLVLHVGAGTFKPVEVDDPAKHRMHEEWFALAEDAARSLTATRLAGGSIWAVGTTAARALESAVRSDGSFGHATGETRIFIRPPRRPGAVDKLLTNFHLPRSTLIMLVAAMAGYDLTMRAYREAVSTGYRFYSYGDAMVII
ncbi:MAG: tRNA preQ1(34) S-adenosylmethionine ribosyltransferase-isomerase QueA [Gemmatimonadaceae bacterium]